MASSSVLLYSLLAVLAAATASPQLLDKRNEVRLDVGHEKFQRLLHDGLLNKLMRTRDGADEYTVLERRLVDLLLSFRDKLTLPLPGLGLPTLDPFEFTAGKAIKINNKFVSLDAKLASVYSQGVSKFQVSKFGLFLVERLGVLDLTLPNFSAELTLDVAAGSWISPLKVPVVDQLKIKFSSPEIKLGLRGKISVKNNRLSMQSTKIGLDLGEWNLEILSENAAGTLQQNPGLNAVIADLAKSLAPRLLKDWTPVAEKYATVRLDEKLQELQLSDIIHNLGSDF